MTNREKHRNGTSAVHGTAVAALLYVVPVRIASKFHEKQEFRDVRSTRSNG